MRAESGMLTRTHTEACALVTPAVLFVAPPAMQAPAVVLRARILAQHIQPCQKAGHPRDFLDAIQSRHVIFIND